MLHRDGEQVPLGDKAQEGAEAYYGVRQQGLGLAQEAVTGRENPSVREDTRRMAEEVKGKGLQAKGQAEGEAREWQDASGDEKEEKKSGVMAKMRAMRDNVRDTFNDRVPEEHRNKANDKFESGKKFLTEEYFPEERRDQFIFRFKKVLIECQKHNDYQEAMRWLLDFLAEYLSHARTASSVAGTDTSAAAHPHHPKNNTSLNIAMLELRTLLERFANGTSMDVIIDPLSKLADSARKDPALREWFNEANEYLRRVLLEPGYVLQPQCDREARRLQEKGKGFWSTGNTPTASPVVGSSPTTGTSALGGVGHTGTYGAGSIGAPGQQNVAPGGVPHGATGAVAGVGSGSVGAQGRYKDEFDNVFRGVGGWFKAMGDDKLNQRFGNDWARLTKDLLFDNEGGLKFKPELWNDIRKVIVPELIQQVGYIPIPRIEYTDDTFDLVVENLTLQGRNLFPNVVAVEAHNFVKFSPYDAISDDSHHKITLHLE